MLEDTMLTEGLFFARAGRCLFRAACNRRNNIEEAIAFDRYGYGYVLSVTVEHDTNVFPFLAGAFRAPLVSPSCYHAAICTYS